MPRRRSSTLSCITSSSPMVILPDVGSTSRLIIRIVVVLPQPEGPTSTTNSPASISRLIESTAGSSVPAYSLVTSCRVIGAPPLLPCLEVAADSDVDSDVASDTDPPRGGQPADQGERQVEEQRERGDQQGPGERLIEGVDAAQVAERVEDQGAQAGSREEGSDRHDPESQLRGNPKPGKHDRPGAVSYTHLTL